MHSHNIKRREVKRVEEKTYTRVFDDPSNFIQHALHVYMNAKIVLSTDE